MPYSKDANYHHIRLKSPKSFGQIRTVSIFQTSYKGKYRKPGVLARRGYNKYTGRWENQSILLPKARYRRK